MGGIFFCLRPMVSQYFGSQFNTKELTQFRIVYDIIFLEINSLKLSNHRINQERHMSTRVQISVTSSRLLLSIRFEPTFLQLKLSTSFAAQKKKKKKRQWGKWDSEMKWVDTTHWLCWDNHFIYFNQSFNVISLFICKVCNFLFTQNPQL